MSIMTVRNKLKRPSSAAPTPTSSWTWSIHNSSKWMQFCQLTASSFPLFSACMGPPSSLKFWKRCLAHLSKHMQAQILRLWWTFWTASCICICSSRLLRNYWSGWSRSCWIALARAILRSSCSCSTILDCSWGRQIRSRWCSWLTFLLGRKTIILRSISWKEQRVMRLLTKKLLFWRKNLMISGIIRVLWRCKCGVLSTCRPGWERIWLVICLSSRWMWPLTRLGRQVMGCGGKRTQKTNSTKTKTTSLLTTSSRSQNKQKLPKQPKNTPWTQMSKKLCSRSSLVLKTASKRLSRSAA